MPSQLYKCAVDGGCKQLLTRKDFFSHKSTLSCKSDSVEDDERSGNQSQLQQEVAHQENEVHQDDNAIGIEGDDDNSEKKDKTLLAVMLCILKWQSLSRISDRSLLVLIHIVRFLLELIADLFGYEVLKTIADELPHTISTIRKKLSITDETFVKLVACDRCHTLYRHSSIVNAEVIKCTDIRWPNHPNRSKRRKCGRKLGRSIDKPLRIYVTYSIQNYLNRFIGRAGFVDSCNRWKDCTRSTDQYNDIYDGKLWLEQMDYLQSARTNFLGLLNVDWFQPYKHSPYSLGAIYMVVLNLPRSERFKPKNIMLLGTIPGPNEPPVQHMNAYLEPIVNELLKLDRGIHLKDTSRYGNVYRFRLLGLSCDLPATRKIGGMLSFSAKQGCSKCKKTFNRLPAANGKTKADYSGFDRQTWLPRQSNEHKGAAKISKLASCEKEMNERQKSTGSRWSVLFQLPYYDPIRGHAVDPMHCLYLGISKKMNKYYFKSGLLSADDLKNIQRTVNRIRVPSSVGRLPRKIASGFNSFTADQWKNWTLLYSSIVLKPYLPAADFQIWMIFVKAVSLLSRKVLTAEDLNLSDMLIHKFVTEVEGRYGKPFCTPNMHMACHLKECILDYGPLYSFWCYSFERYNGILANYNYTSSDISTQMMRRFLEDQAVIDANLPDELNTTIHDLLSNEDNSGTLASIAVAAHNQQAETALSDSIDIMQMNFDKFSDDTIILPDRKVSKYLELQDYINLQSMVESISPPDEQQSSYKVHRRVTYVDWIVYRGETFRIHQTDKANCNVVRAKWLSETHPIKISPGSNLQRAGVIRQILLVKLSANDLPSLNLVIFQVDWFRKHDQLYAFGNHLQMFYCNFCDANECSFLPVQRVICKCALHYTNHAHIKTVLAIPLTGSWALL